MIAATQQVLELPGLLEAIVVRLTTCDIPRACKVARLWRDVDRSSPSTQERRVLKAILPCPTENTQTPHYATSESIRTHNVLDRGFWA